MNAGCQSPVIMAARGSYAANNLYVATLSGLMEPLKIDSNHVNLKVAGDQRACRAPTKVTTKREGT